MYIPSNYTLEEAMKVLDIPEAVLKMIDAVYEEVNSLEKQLEQERRAYELQEEQLSFAGDLIENLLQTVRNGANLRQVKKDVEHNLENSYYEL